MNIELFSISPHDMSDKDSQVSYHQLNMDANSQMYPNKG